MKTCYRCKIDKPLSEFSKDSNNKDGYRGICKQCKSDYDKAMRAKDPEINKLRCRARAAKNKEAAVERVKQWRLNNPEKYKQQQRRRRDRLGKDEINKTRKEWWMTTIVTQPKWRNNLSTKYKTMHPDWEKQFIRMYEKNARRQLSDRYIKKLLTTQAGVKIPKEWIEIKRLQLQIRRMTNEKRNTTTR